MNDVGITIRNIRNAKGYSQEYVANELRIKQAAYSKMESGKSDITIKRLYEIAVLLEVGIYDLIKDEKSLLNEPKESYVTGNNKGGYDVSITIRVNDPVKEQQILKMIGLNK